MKSLGGSQMDDKSREIYYARVSTKDQNLSRQIDAFKKLGAKDEQIICDKASGKDFEREGYQALKGVMGLRAGDTLIIKELDRLGRNKEAVKKELEYWKLKGIRVKVIDLPTTMVDVQTGQEWIIDMINNILIEVLSSIAEQELIKIKTRQSEGLRSMPVINGKRISNKTGRAIGRPAARYPAEWEKYYKEWRQGNITAYQFMDGMNLKRTTFYKLVKQYEKEYGRNPDSGIDM